MQFSYLKFSEPCQADFKLLSLSIAFFSVLVVINFFCALATF